ncbi:hypothetical protein EDD22DRAFT_951009 [Suillus occidentalis]|nr:hypothetical protein EDD22DRAFT_951009 [Suillus occidentalis]
MTVVALLGIAFITRDLSSTMNKKPAQAEAGASSSLPVKARKEACRKRETRLDREKLADDMIVERSPSLGPPPPNEGFLLQCTPSLGPPSPDEDILPQHTPSLDPPPPDEDILLQHIPSPDPPPPAQALPEHQHVAIDVNKLTTLAILPKMKNTIEFICDLQNASLDDPCSKLNAAALHCLREPHQAPLEINQPAIHFAISEYFALEHSAQDAYECIRRSAGHCFAGDVN